MGDPRRIRKKYQGPKHPWNKARIDEETQLRKDYGLKNKQEIWRFVSKLKSFTNQAKKLIIARTTQAEKERKQLIARLNKLGLVSTDAQLDDVLGLSVRNFLDRRLQTQIYKKGLARSVKQAR